MKKLYTSRQSTAQYRHADRFLIYLAKNLSAHSLEEINSLQEWQVKRLLSKQQLSWMLGLPPIDHQSELHPKILGLIQREHYTIEKVVIQSLKGLYVTANFYLPHNRPSPLPCVIYLNGHFPSIDGAKIGYQDRYLWYPANGFALLVIDPLGFGEIPGIHPGTNRLNKWNWLSLGYTPAGVEVWNVMRALDWLGTRHEVDSTRIGVTGISGGGVMTQYIAALDERVVVAAPSCSTFTIGTQASLGLIPQQCDCTFYPNVFQIDFPEVLALIAPRPLLILGGRKDEIFPPAGFYEAFRKVSRIYSLYEDSEASEPKIRLVESNKGHTDPPRFLLETRRFMCMWLRNTVEFDPKTEVQTPKSEKSEILRCTIDIIPSALNYTIDFNWINKTKASLPLSKQDWILRSENILNILRSRIFGWFPKSDIPFKTRRLISSGGFLTDLSDFGEYEFESEHGVKVSACLLMPKGKRGPIPVIVWIKESLEHVKFPEIDEFFPFLRTHIIIILTSRFSGNSLSAFDYARIERTAALLGRSVASMRVWDLLRTLEWAFRDRRIEHSGITVYGCGQTGIIGLYAALFNLDVGHVILRDPPFSHIEGPALPTILRDTDIDEVSALLAPRRLSILSQRKGDHAFTQSIYELFSAQMAFGYVSSLPEAILDQPEDNADLSDGDTIIPC